MFIPVPGVARFELIFTAAGSRVENVYHVKKIATSWDVTSLATVADKFIAWYDETLKSQVSSSVNLALVVATDHSSATGPRLEYTEGLPIAGSNAGVLLPNNATVAASWRTALRGRSYRGRTFHVGMTQSQVEGSNLAAGAQAALQLVYSNLMSAVNDSDHQLVVVSRFNQGTSRIIGAATPINNVTIDPVVDSQRRRLPARGA